MKKCFFLIIALTVLISSGCAEKKIGFGGKVTYSDDDSPLNVGTVCFVNSTTICRGTLKPDGTYTIGTMTEKDGVAPGTYNVYVSSAIKEVGTDQYGNMLEEPLIDEKFTSPQTSGLTCEVVSGGTFDFKVDRHVPKPGAKKPK